MANQEKVKVNAEGTVENPTEVTDKGEPDKDCNCNCFELSEEYKNLRITQEELQLAYLYTDLFERMVKIQKTGKYKKGYRLEDLSDKLLSKIDAIINKII